MEKYGLTENPFKIVHNHEIIGESQNKTFDRVLELFEANAATESGSGDRFIAAFKGDYGFGKSFFLNKITEATTKKTARFKKVVKKNVNIMFANFAILTENKTLPSQLMLHLYAKIVDSLGGNGETTLLNLYKELEDKAGKENLEIKDLIEDLDRNFRKAILSLGGDSDLQYIALKWLKAQKLTQRELRDIGLPDSIKTPDLAEKCIFQLLKLLNILDYGLLTVLIDELEEVSTAVGKKQFLRVFLVFKELFDKYEDNRYEHLKPLAPIGFFVSLTPQAWQEVEIGADEDTGMTPVMSRISDNVFEMERFSQTDAKDFIKMFLASARIKGFNKDALFPFDEQGIKIIWDQTYGNPRDIILNCKSMLESARRSGENKIDSNFVNKYYAKRGGGVSQSETDTTSTIDFLEGEEKI